MSLLDRLRKRERPPAAWPPPAPRSPGSRAPATPPVEPPYVSPATACIAAHDWEGALRLGPEGRDALLAELRRVAALDPAPRQFRRYDVADPHDAWGIIRTLAELHDPVVLDVLIELATPMTDASDALAGELVEGIARCQLDAAVPLLLDRALHHRDPYSGTGIVAGDVLVAYPAPVTLSAVVAALVTAAPDERATLASILGRLPDPSALDPLLTLLDDPDATVRNRAAEAIGMRGDRRAVPTLLIAEERDRRTRRRGYGAVAFDGRPSPRLEALDALVGDDAAAPSPAASGPPFAVEGAWLARTASARAANADAVSAAVADLPEPPASSWTVDELVGVLCRPGVSCDGGLPSVVRYDDPKAFDLDVERCRALVGHVGDVADGEPWDDHQGGQAWFRTVAVPCADGNLELRVVDRFEPLY